MYCCQCGARAGGNFCSACGARLQLPDTVADVSEVTEVSADWSDIVDYETLLSVPEVRDTIARHAALSRQRLTGEEFLRHCDKALTPLTVVPVSVIASVAQPLYAKLGAKTGKTRSETFDQPPGAVLLALLCSFARSGYALRYAQQISDGCVLNVTLPSDIWSFEGDLEVTVHRETDGTRVEAATVIKGQLFDWGKSTRCLEELFGDLHAPPAA